MVNYKSGGRRKIIANGVTFNVPATATLIHLIEPVAGSSAADGMLKDNSIYQVTAGKTFFLKKIVIHTDATGLGSVAINQGDTENAETALKLTITLTGGIAAVIEYMVEISFASAKFVTINPSATVVTYIEMIGYEV